MVFDRLREIGRSFLEPPLGDEGPAVDIGAQKDALHSLKKTTLGLADTLGALAHPGKPTTPADYTAAAQLLAGKPQTDTLNELSIAPAGLKTKVEEYKTQAKAQLGILTAANPAGGKSPTVDQVWNPRIWCDLSGDPSGNPPGQNIKGWTVSNEALEKDGHGDFWRFDNCHWQETTFCPATSFDPERYAGSSFDGTTTFDGLQDGQHVVLANAAYTGPVKCQNFRGGAFTVGDATHLAGGLDISGTRVALHIGPRAKIDGLDATDAHLIELSAGAGSVISNPVFRGTTVFSRAGGVAGSSWVGDSDPSHAAFEDANLAHCDFSGANLSNIRVRVRTGNLNDLKGWNLSGATVSNMIITVTDDKGNALRNYPIRNRDDLSNLKIDGKPLGITVDATAKVVFGEDGQKMLNTMNVLDAGRTLGSALTQAAAMTAAAPPQQQVAAVQAPAILPPAVTAPVSAPGAPADPALGLSASTTQQPLVAAVRARTNNAFINIELAEEDAAKAAARQAAAKIGKVAMQISGGHAVTDHAGPQKFSGDGVADAQKSVEAAREAQNQKWAESRLATISRDTPKPA